MIVEQLKRFKEKLRLHRLFIKEACRFWCLTLKYNASMNTDADRQKMEYTILRLNHTIEKGMSMRNPRKGFGQQKVVTVMERLQRYQELYGQQNAQFFVYPLSTIRSYIDYTEQSGVEIPHIKAQFEQLCAATGHVGVKGHAGIAEVSGRDIQEKAEGNFADLLYSRHSIRYFADRKVEHALIDEALRLAQRTPSACNRQGWMTHVYEGDESVRLVRWQGGANGFEEEMRCTILVTANLKAFLSHETHQAYVDGGLYAMNLINALHHLGLATMPLSCGFQSDKLRQLAAFGIPENEVPIVIIGVGHLQERFNVAVSERKDITFTNRYH